MKVAITGHSGGLGKAIADRLARDGHEIVGFSLDNGYNISTTEGFRQIVDESLDCDLFVNCAHDRGDRSNGQVNILLRLFHFWQNEEKHIISIGSNAPDYYPPEASGASHYRASKAALDALSLELSVKGKACRVSIVRPNWINSPAAVQAEKHRGITLAKLESDEVADIVATIVDLGPKITISSVTLSRTIHAPDGGDEKKWWRGRS